MSINHWYPRYTADYQTKTADLSLLEHGVYSVLLDHYYSTEKPLPANAVLLHRVCRAFADEEKLALQIVLDRFFVKMPDGYHNKRADEELEKRKDISKKRQKAANTRYENLDANAPANAHTSTSTFTSTSIDNPPTPLKGGLVLTGKENSHGRRKKGSGTDEGKRLAEKYLSGEIQC